MDPLRLSNTVHKGYQIAEKNHTRRNRREDSEDAAKGISHKLHQNGQRLQNHGWRRENAVQALVESRHN
jgi:hypothetical protein